MTFPDFVTQYELEQAHPIPGMVRYTETGLDHAVVKLFERDRPELETILPLTPTEVPEHGEAAVREFNVIGAGEHSLPNGRAPRTYTLRGTLPGGPRATNRAIHDWRPPQDIAGQIRGWLARSALLHLQVYSRAGPLDVPCYVKSYSFTRQSWAGDLGFDVQVTEWRTLRIRVDDGTDTTAALTEASEEAAGGSEQEPPDEPTPTTYTVVAGDSLWLIAKNMLGDTGRWPELAAANPDIDPRVIYPGQELIIPGGTTAEEDAD